VHGLVLLVIARAATGHLAEARRSLEALEEIAGDCRDRHVQVELARARSLVYEAEGNPASATEAARRALELAKEYGLTYEVAVHAHRLGSMHLRADQDKRAFAALRLSNEVSSEHGFTRLQWRNVCLLGFLDAMRFDSEQGRARMQQAIEHAHDRNYVLDLIDEKYLLAMVEQKRGETDRARALLREVVQLAEPHGHARPHADAARALTAIADGAPIALPR
jgi:eukaryotic-like serine/threonine-protein kinase